VSVVTCIVFLAVTRRWRPVAFLAAVMFGELAAFLAAAAVVKRPRPDVTQLDKNLPTSAFPSGHVAATTCLYVAIAILVIGTARGWWRFLFLIPAIAMPVLVTISRIYRGEHHPTDVLGSLVFAGLWLTATTMLIKPTAAESRGRRDEACPGRGPGADRVDFAAVAEPLPLPARARPWSVRAGRRAGRILVSP
jgi:undecaprenyl-diphosphatase